MNAPAAINDSKAKAELARQEKEKKKWQQENASNGPQPRAGLAAASVDGQDGTDGSLLPPSAAHDQSANQWPDKG